MNKKIYIAFVLLFFCSTACLLAQNANLYTQYLFNGLVINPAYAGTHQALSATSIVRKQWLGIEGSPFTSTFSVHSPVNKHRSSFGGLLYQSSTGVYNELSLQGMYSYRIPFSETRQLSLGLGVGFTDYAMRYSQLTHQNPDDPAIPGDNRHLTQPVVSGGAYYYTPSSFIGISAQNLTGWIYRSKDADDLRAYNHLFFNAGTLINLSPGLKLKPALLLHYYTSSPLLIDLNLHALIDEVIWVGVSYRHEVSINYMIRFNIGRQLSVGYSYDQSINASAVTQNGAHEIVLSYLFKYFKKNIVHPRHF